MKAWGLPRSPPRPSPLYPSSSSVTFTSRRVPGAPGCSSPLSPPPPAGVGSGLRARRALPTSPAPWTAHPAARRPLHSSRDGVLLAQPSRSPFLSRLSPSRPASLVLTVLADSAVVRAGNFTPLLCTRYCCYL